MCYDQKEKFAKYSKFQDFIIGESFGVEVDKVVKSRVEHLKSLQLHLGHGLVTFFPLIPYLDLPTSIPMNFLSSLVLFKSGAACTKAQSWVALHFGRLVKNPSVFVLTLTLDKM